jgi:hypothetical protein
MSPCRLVACFWLLDLSCCRKIWDWKQWAKGYDHAGTACWPADDLVSHTPCRRSRSKLTIGHLWSLFFLLFLLLFFLFILTVLAGGDPAVTVILDGLVLTREIDTLVLDRVGLSPLAEVASTRRKVGSDLRSRRDPVGQRVFAVLNDRLGCFVSVVGVAGLARRHRVVVDELKQVFSVTGDNGNFFTVLADRVELVVECGLQFFAGDVGQLGFRDQGLGLCSDEFLLQDHNTRAVGLLVLELSDLVGDLLLAVAGGLNRRFNVADGLDGHAVLIIAVYKLIFQLADLVDQDTELVGDIADVLVASLSPDRELLLLSH